MLRHVGQELAGHGEDKAIGEASSLRIERDVDPKAANPSLLLRYRSYGGTYSTVL
jgi:hypothetical protein